MGEGGAGPAPVHADTSSPQPSPHHARAPRTTSGYETREEGNARAGRVAQWLHARARADPHRGTDREGMVVLVSHADFLDLLLKHLVLPAISPTHAHSQSHAHGDVGAEAHGAAGCVCEGVVVRDVHNKPLFNFTNTGTAMVLLEGGDGPWDARLEWMGRTGHLTQGSGSYREDELAFGRARL